MTGRFGIQRHLGSFFTAAIVCCAALSGAQADTIDTPSVIETQSYPLAYGDDQSSRAMFNYSIRRTNDVTRFEPNISKRLGRATSQMSLTGHADSRDGNIEVKGNIRGDDAKLSKLFDAGALNRTSLWVRAEFERGKTASKDFDESLVYMGLDYRLDRNTVMGLLAQFDLADEQNTAGRRFREGWLAGPYIISRLSDGLVFDGRIAWGKARNAVALDEITPGEAEADRLLLKSQISGKIPLDVWELNPAVSLLYVQEDGPAFLDGGQVMPGEDLTLGRISFGPGATTSFMFDETIKMTPRVRVQGTWDFDQEGQLNLTSGIPASADMLRARLDGGLEAQLSDKRRLVFDGYYDGIGVSGFDAYGFKVGMSVQLN